MVVDRTYYDALEVDPAASEVEIKKAYRRLAIKHHPDKNPDDETSHQKFQAIGEAYQVLSDKQLRAAYDKYGKERAKPDSGFEDPAEFFSMIFGGEAFADWIGEISLMKDLTKTMDITMREMEEEEAAAEAEGKPAPEVTGEDKAAAAAAATAGATSAAPSTGHIYTATSTSEKPLHAGPTPQPATAPPPPSVSTPADSTPLTGSTIPAPSNAQPFGHTGTSPSGSGTSTPRPSGIPTRLAISDKSYEDAQQTAAGMSEREKELRAKEKKRGLSKEQREELAAYEIERKRIRDERINTLTRKLVDKLSVWTETDKGADVTESFKRKMREEAENLKMESFGIEILHSIGQTYTQKATSFLKSQKFLGISGFFSRLKDKGTLVKETWNTISTAIDAQITMEEMAKAEAQGGEDWTDEKRAEFEKRVTGKILAAAWKGSRFEIQSVLRDVCDKALNDKSVKLDKRVERAQALLVLGDIFATAERDPDEEGDFLAFEQLMAEAAAKKDKKGDKKDKNGKDKKSQSHKTGHEAEKPVPPPQAS